MTPVSDNGTLARMSTGDGGLDRILDGGLIRRSVAIVQGSPGAGKTILANQMAFDHARDGGRTLYVTLLAESHGRMAAFLRGMEFFDDAEVARSIRYLSGYTTLLDEGPVGLLRLLGMQARSFRSTLVVLDGLFVLDDCCGSENDYRRFINDLAQQAELMGFTVLLLTNSKRPSSSPEYTMVDAWIELSRMPSGYRSIRYLEVHKLRGSDFVPGQHAVQISGSGIETLPRLEAVLGTAPSVPDAEGRLSTGIGKLDAMTHGGYPENSTTLVLGATGIGKSTLGLHFLAGCTPERPGLLFGFYETRERMVRKARDRGLDLQRLLDSGAVRMVWHPPTENRLDVLGHELLRHVRGGGVRRLVVDGIDAFEQSAANPERLGRYLSALTNELRGAGCTSLFTSELAELLGDEPRIRSGGSVAVAENIVLLRYVEADAALHRTLVLVKVRDSDFDTRVHGFRITSQGLDIGDALADRAGRGAASPTVSGS